MEPNPGREKEQCRNGHRDEEFHLVMKESAIIQKSDEREQGRARENADNLARRRLTQRDQNGENKPAINCNAAEKRDRLQMNFPRAGLVHQADAQREMPHRGRKSDRG